jgi:hypothetical protein
VFSVQSFVSQTTSLPNEIFIEDARAAVAEAPAGTVILNQPVPENVMVGSFGASGEDSRVIGIMENAADKARISWTTQPRGTVDHLMVFGPDGRLHNPAIYGEGSVRLPKGQRQCYVPSNGQLVVRFAVKTPSYSQVLRLGYLASAAENGENVTVSYGGASKVLTLKAGLHSAYVPVRGSARSVTFSGEPVTKSALCIGWMQAGFIVPSTSGVTIPAAF